MDEQAVAPGMESFWRIFGDMSWLMYFAGLCLCLAAVWLWLPKNRWWLLALLTVGIALIAPRRSIPSAQDSDWVPASALALFSLAFEPDMVLEALRTAFIWAAVFVCLCASVLGGMAFVRHRRKQRKAQS